MARSPDLTCPKTSSGVLGKRSRTTPLVTPITLAEPVGFKYLDSSDLPRCHFHAHPRMNTALELGCCSTRQGRISGGWTPRRRTRPYEYVGSARGLGDKPTEGDRSAFWRWDRI